MSNRLVSETSPYLLQHAHNPVDWYAWGPEAFDAARSQNKPIFLSVGYSTCYWCHVMERESFENDAIAREMNARFINIKVDREERPDVDQLYMTAVQVLTRHGGWPMSVFLLPDLRPFYGGTYFPPTDAHGRPGFVTVLRAIDDAFHERRTEVEQSAAQLQHMLQQLAEPQPSGRAITIDQKFIDEMIERSTSDFDPLNGGFGGAPKFPRETLLELLLQSQVANRKSQMLKSSLDAMADGGIRDHLGGAFHRYSTDARWLVPHFEIMLYDNAMLGWIYAEASKQFDELRYGRIAQDILSFVIREMTSPSGAFYTALDAEVDAMEGASYLWTKAQVDEALPAERAERFNRVYGLDRGPNFVDPHHGAGVPDRNVLYLPAGAPDHDDEIKLMESREILYGVRRQRKQPRLDDKIITSWNALMIRAMAHAGSVLKSSELIETASRAAEFLLLHHRRDDGTLYRTSRDGVAKHDAFLDDYAFFAQALLALDEVGAAGHPWREHALSLIDVMMQKFASPRGGLYFTAAGADDLIVRQMIGSDSPLPAGAAVGASVLMQVGRTDDARRVLECFASSLVQNAEAMSAMLQAVQQYVSSHGPIEVAASSIEKPARLRSPQQLAADVVTLSARWIDPTTLEVVVHVAEGFHINAQDAGDKLIATTLAAIDEPDAAVEYPPGQERRFSFSAEPIRVYAGDATFTVKFARPRDVARRLTLSITYQACDDNACLAPVTKRFEIT